MPMMALEEVGSVVIKLHGMEYRNQQQIDRATDQAADRPVDRPIIIQKTPG
jgi:hypothetical protein